MDNTELLNIIKYYVPINNDLYNNLLSSNENKLLCNVKMKFIGKFVFESIISDYIINNEITNKYIMDECFLLKVKIDLCNQKNISCIYDKLLNNNNSSISLINKHNIFLILIGKIYTCIGFDLCKILIYNLINKYINLDDILLDNNKKIIITQNNIFDIENTISNKTINKKNTILNENNIHITHEYIKKMLSIFNVEYKIKNKNNIYLYQKAMINCSYVTSSYNENTKVLLDSENQNDNIMKLYNESYDKLEFLGDSIIHAIFSDYLYSRYEYSKDAKEGFLTKIRTKLENGKQLAKFSMIIGLHKYAVISQNKEKYDRNEIIEYYDIYEDIFEAFIAALYKDKGFLICKKFLFNLLNKEIDFAQILSEDDNYKDLLLKYCHKFNLGEIKYEEIKRYGPDNKKTFVMDVLLNGNPIGKGIGRSKKEGEQKAAHFALNFLGYYEKEKDDDAALDIDIF
jgi:dsRNA-specific ribonuclease